MKRFPQDDFRKRQEHQDGQRDRDEEILPVAQPAAPTLHFGHDWDFGGEMEAGVAAHFLFPG